MDMSECGLVEGLGVGGVRSLRVWRVGFKVLSRRFLGFSPQFRSHVPRVLQAS